MKLVKIFFASLIASAAISSSLAAPTVQNSLSPALPSGTVITANTGANTSSSVLSNDPHEKKHHSKAGKEAKVPSAPININTATAKELQSLSGVGEKRAEAIVKWREDHGNFTSIEDLNKIKGVSQKWIEKNRAYLSIGGTTTH